jgi:transcriptional repressor NrdR
MRCPSCGQSHTDVVDSRTTSDGVRRRRCCPSCHRRFTTYEYPASTVPFVLKRDGRSEEFDPTKLISGLRKACAKRPISESQIEAIAAKVTGQVMAQGAAEVPSHKIGELVLDELRSLDQVAYIRFATVYLRMNDLAEIQREVDNLLHCR